ncbi:MAG: M28 family peptidase [Bacteroidota bacterium]
MLRKRPIRLRMSGALILSIAFQWTLFAGQGRTIGDIMLDHVKKIEYQNEIGRRQFIKDKLKEFGVSFSVMGFDTVMFYNGKTSDMKGENIIVSYGDAKNKIVVGAHLDAIFGMPGANDNGSGVAVLLELIHDLQYRHFHHRIDLCFFDLEEPGLIGSSIYVRRFDANYTLTGMINLDVEGSGDEIYVGPTAGEHHAILLKYIHQAKDETKFPYYEDQIFPETDNESFGDADLENISISVVPGGDGKRISDFYRIPPAGKQKMEKYPLILKIMHTKDDTSALVEPKSLEMAYSFAMKTLLLLDDGEK